MKVTVTLCSFQVEGSDPIVYEWLKKLTNKYTIHEIQNELLKIMALNVLRKVSACLHSSSFYSIMADETIDISNREQVTIILRWVDDTDFSVNEEFVGLYAVPSIGSDMLVSIIKLRYSDLTKLATVKG